eukprot:1143859-Pelagomonas_calceolata.AAC.9
MASSAPHPTASAQQQDANIPLPQQQDANMVSYDTVPYRDGFMLQSRELDGGFMVQQDQVETGSPSAGGQHGISQAPSTFATLSTAMTAPPMALQGSSSNNNNSRDSIITADAQFSQGPPVRHLSLPPPGVEKECIPSSLSQDCNGLCAFVCVV